jgi:hypothetical protein
MSFLQDKINAAEREIETCTALMKDHIALGYTDIAAKCEEKINEHKEFIARLQERIDESD